MREQQVNMDMEVEMEVSHQVDDDFAGECNIEHKECLDMAVAKECKECTVMKDNTRESIEHENFRSSVSVGTQNTLGFELATSALNGN